VRSLRSTPVSGLLAATTVAVIAAVHLQQYVEFMSEVPKVGVLFLLNAAGGAGLVLALLSCERPLRILAAFGAIGLALGSLISIGIALSGNFLGYSEPTLRLPIAIAIVAEALALPLLARLLVQERRRRGAPQQPQS
jgi:hypothetical protein